HAILGHRHRLSGIAVAVVTGRLLLLILEVYIQLSGQHPLRQALLQLADQTVVAQQPGAVLAPLQQLVDQLIINRRFGASCHVPSSGRYHGSTHRICYTLSGRGRLRSLWPKLVKFPSCPGHSRNANGSAPGRRPLQYPANPDPSHPDGSMRTKAEIVSNWLPRYTGSPLKDFGEYILLTNFSNYVEWFAAWHQVQVVGRDKAMPVAHADGLSIINFGMGSANAATIMDL